MGDLRATLRELLSAATRGRGVASVSVIERPGVAPRTCWSPESPAEPAFLAYSITKTFIAALVLMLCEEGLLSLEERLVKWFPHIAQADRISLRQLLNHTAGIPDYGGSEAYHGSVRCRSSTPWALERFAAETFEKGLLFMPGQGWAYSNPGYMLVKQIVEETTGASFRCLISKRIAQPLELKRTFVAESIEDLASLAPGTSTMLAKDGSPREVRAHYHPGWVSHGVVASTASEIASFFDGLFRGTLLSPKSLHQMMQWVLVPMATSSNSCVLASPLRFGKPSYGLGLMGDLASPWGLVVGHNGAGPCYGASALRACDLGGVSVCAMGAIENDFSAEGLVAGVLDHFADRR